MFPFWQKDRREKALRRTLIILAGVGALLMAYLTKIHITIDKSSFCDFSEGFSCDLVNQSAYSEILGIPLAALGLVFFLTIIVIMLFDRKLDVKAFPLVLTLTSFALAFGLALSAIELFLIASFCLFCEASKVIMIIIIAISAYGLGFVREKIKISNIIIAIIIGLIFGGLVAWGGF